MPRTVLLSKVSLLATLVLLPVLGLLASRAEFGTPIVQDWLPKSSAAVEQYDTFRRRFGEDQFLIVSWRDCRWDDPRLIHLANSLRELAARDVTIGILEIIDSHSSVVGLSDRRSGISRSAALARLRGVTVGLSGEGFLSVRLAAGNPQVYQPLIDEIEEIGSHTPGLEDTELILAGEPVQVATIDRSSRETIGRYVLPSSIAAVCVAWLCLRSFRLTAIVFAFAGIGQLVGLSLISVFLGQMSALLVVLPTLVFMLVLSAAIHLVSYYVESGGAGNQQAGSQSLRIGFRPCALATLTTAFGFGSLIVSSLSPVWHFGSLAAAGLITATVVLLSAFAAAADFRLPNRLQAWAERLAHKLGRSTRAVGDDPWLRREQQAASALAKFCEKASRPLSIVGILSLAAALMGIPKLRTSTEFEHMFAASSPAIESLNWVREHLGPINSLEVVVEIPNARSLDMLDRVECVRNVHAVLLELDVVTSVASAATFLPRPSQRSTLRSVIQRAVMRRRVEAALPTLADARVHHIEQSGEAGSEFWRVTARIAGLTNENYQHIYQQVDQTAERGIASGPLPTVPTVEIGGLRTVIESAHTSLLADLGTSFLTAFLLITPVMMLIVRGFWSGMLLMIPNTIPVAIVFGSMGWLGVRLDVASILTASVALGIAVDDTLHFVNWYVRRLADGASRNDAVRSAVIACSRPMLHTTVICTAAMAPFLLCDFVPTSKFALLMILTLSGAILGDLILLPALLLSPLGRLVGKRSATDSQQTN
ncbi:MAG: MMPL family transporter [Aureliella sp.]